MCYVTDRTSLSEKGDERSLGDFSVFKVDFFDIWRSVVFFVIFKDDEGLLFFVEIVVVNDALEFRFVWILDVKETLFFYVSSVDVVTSESVFITVRF